ncbi:MAG: tRNA glutamyl-Q(34) synthetase GluQRS, partial [Litoreibacter sp.]|nr:tRNA glutamyl-Q(34) synthetase GluQRS [Litoreibacter sp.]
DTLVFEETGAGPDGQTGTIRFTLREMLETIGDIVLCRRDMGTSYHLSVVLDDAAQGITHVIRGQDLFEATRIHVVLQRLLGLPTPVYHHHRLIRDDAGKRLAKRDDARAIAKYRAEGCTPQDIRKMVGL